MICPRCGAQYEIDRAAIPASGREVECSACGHMWRQAGAPFDPAERPVLSRPLGESILSVLREEAARELAARAADASAPASISAAGEEGTDPRFAHLPPAPASADILATHLDHAAQTNPQTPTSALSVPGAAPATLAGGDASGAAGRVPLNLDLRQDGPADPLADAAISPEPGAPVFPAGRDADPTLGPNRPSSVAPSPVAPSSSPEQALPEQAASEQAPSEQALSQTRAPTPTVAAPVPSRGGYRAGFAAAWMVVGLAVAAYALAPRLAGTGALGVWAGAWHQQVDQWRGALHDRIEALRGPGS